MKREQICEICANVSDMTGEEISFLIDLALSKGAVGAWAESVLVREHKPAFRFVVQCVKERATGLCELVLKNSTAAAITMEVKNLLTMDEETVYLETSLGMVRIAKAGQNRRIVYEDLARIANREGMSIAETRKRILEEIDT